MSSRSSSRSTRRSTHLLVRTHSHLPGQINLLALNAGIQAPTPWTDAAAFQRVLGVNLFGVINGIATCLPTVKATSPAAIVITGSKQGITNPPGNFPAYNASKAAVKALAEHLDYDLRNDKNVAVHLLVPGWTFTGLSGNRPGSGKEKPEGAWSADQVVDFLEGKMAEGQFWVLCPDDHVTEALVSFIHHISWPRFRACWFVNCHQCNRRMLCVEQGKCADVLYRTARECFGAHLMPLRAGLL